MPAKLENLSDRPVVLLLASGETVRLSPGDTSDPISDAEVRANAKIDKLAVQGVIALHESPKRSSAEKGSKPAARTEVKRSTKS